MTRANVIDLQEFKSFLKMKRSQEHYGKYLKTLGHSQLESEINFLLGENSNETDDQDLHSRGRILLEEINSRITT